MNYYSSSSKHNLVGVIAIILAVVLLLGALVTVLGVGSNGFKDWSNFNGVPKSSYNMNIESLDEFVGVTLHREDFAFCESTYDMTEEEREELQVPADMNIEYFGAILNVERYGVDFIFPEEGIYTFTVKINGKQYVIEDVHMLDQATSKEGFLAQFNIITEEGEDNDLFEGDAKGYAFIFANMTAFDYINEIIAEGGASFLIYNINAEKLESFELVSYERTGDLVIPQAEEGTDAE